AAALHDPGRQTISLHDAAGDILHEFDLAVAAEDVPYTVGADEGNREGLWYWQVGKMDVDLSVEGVRYWTPEPASYFDPQRTDLRLTPRKTARYLMPGETADYRVLLFPPEGSTDGFDISITQPEQPGVRFELADPAIQPVTYADNRMVIPVSATAEEGCVPGDEFDAYLEVTASENPLAVGRTWLQARIGQSPASEPLDLPIVLRPFEHEGWQFGYAPEFEPNSAYFDPENRAWIRHRTEDSHWSAGAQVLSGDRFVLREWTEALQENHPGYQRPSSGSGFRGARWAFDDEGGAWTTMRLAGMPDGYADAIIYTPDRGRTWQSHVIDATASDIEWFTGHNDFDTPPVLGYRQTAPHPATYASYHDLLLHLPSIEDGRLTVPEPILITDNCFGNSVHSGAPPALATRDGRTHIVWGEITDPEDPGVPTYVATYDHESGSLSEKVFIEFAPPVNDVHNTPAIVLDSEGYIHVVTGAHGNNFYYARSLEPNTVSAGFTEAVKVHDAGWIDADTDADGRAAQTYIGLVCDPDDTLHLIYRQNRKGLEDYLTDYGYYMGLSYQRKPKGGEWGPVQPLVIPPVGGYSIYYHKLTIDRTGGLWITYNHWTNHAYQNAFPERYHHRAMITSTDGGDTWRLARTEDFVEAARAYEER
ncbi:MAG: BNR-4 repeat-containing protein, partial [Armatimonadota bacterium]